MLAASNTSQRLSPRQRAGHAVTALQKPDACCQIVGSWRQALASQGNGKLKPTARAALYLKWPQGRAIEASTTMTAPQPNGRFC